MKWWSALLVVVGLGAGVYVLPVAWSQEEIELGLEGASTESSAPVKETEEEVSFDDFAEDGQTPKEKKASKGEAGQPKSDRVQDERLAEEPLPEESLDEEMTLEPLQGDENQVTDIPDEAPKPEVTPEEMTPPPPTVAEPEPTPEPSLAPVVDDSPDLDLEARLHDIYVNYHSKKMTDGEWGQILGGREAETYRIQRGDTLWGISKTFFNDGNYWPKIWQLNSAITNPHLIQPGNTIRFLLGTESETPAFTVTEGGEEPVELPVGDAGAAGIAPPVAQPTPQPGEGQEGATAAQGALQGAPSDEVEIPPPSEEYKPVLNMVPPSLPEWTLQRHGDEYDDVGVDYGRRKILDLPDRKYLEAFVDTETVRFDGEVREIEGGGDSAATYQHVFLALPPGQYTTGERFTVVKRLGRLKRVSTEVAMLEPELGWQYQVQGEVKLADLLSSVADKKGVRSDVFRALVVRSLSRIERGSQVVRGALPTLSVSPEGERSDILTQIVGAHEVDGQKTLSLHSLAFLAGGARNGLREGQILTVRANTRVRNRESIIKESYIPVGLLKVARVGEKFSTAIVLKVWDAIYVGDVTGAGKVVPPEPPERRKVPGPATARNSAPATPEQPGEEEIDDATFDDFSDQDLEGE